MRLFEWMKKGSKQHRSPIFTDTQTQVPCFEQLEPRILLSADVSLFQDIQPFETGVEQVISVDIERGAVASGEGAGVRSQGSGVRGQ